MSSNRKSVPSARLETRQITNTGPRRSVRGFAFVKARKVTLYSSERTTRSLEEYQHGDQLV